MALLKSHSAILRSLNPKDKMAAIFVGYLAQWVDIGFADVAVVKRLLTRFTPSSRRELPLTHYVHLCMAESLVAMWEHRYDQAIRHLETVISLSHEIRDPELEIMSNFWLGKCHMRSGRLENAINYTVIAKDLATEMGWHGVSTLIQVLHSDLTSQLGKPNEALKILQAIQPAHARIRC